MIFLGKISKKWQQDFSLYIPQYRILTLSTIGLTHNYITYSDYGIIEVKHGTNTRMWRLWFRSSRTIRRIVRELRLGNVRNILDRWWWMVIELYVFIAFVFVFVVTFCEAFEVFEWIAKSATVTGSPILYTTLNYVGSVSQSLEVKISRVSTLRVRCSCPPAGVCRMYKHTTLEGSI